MNTPTSLDWWVVLSNLSYWLAAAVAGWVHRWPLMTQVLTVGTVSGLYHYCHDTALNADAPGRGYLSDNGCPEAVAWRTNKADHLLSHWTLGSTLAVLLPSGWLGTDAILAVLLFPVHLALVEWTGWYHSSDVDDRELLCQLATALSAPILKYLWCVNYERLDAWLYWRTLSKRAGRGAAWGLAVGLLLLAAVAGGLLWDTALSSQATHGLWHVVSATLIALVVMVPHWSRPQYVALTGIAL